MSNNISNHLENISVTYIPFFDKTENDIRIYYFIPKTTDEVDIREDGVYLNDILKYPLNIFVPLKVRINTGIVILNFIKEPFDYNSNTPIDNADVILEDYSFEISENKLVKHNFKESFFEFILREDNNLFLDFMHNNDDNTPTLFLKRFYDLSLLLERYPPMGAVPYITLIDKDKFLYTLWGDLKFDGGYYIKDNKVFDQNDDENTSFTRSIFGSKYPTPYSSLKSNINGHSFVFYLYPPTNYTFNENDCLTFVDDKLVPNDANSDLLIEYFDTVSMIKYSLKSNPDLAIYFKIGTVLDYVNQNFTNNSPNNSTDKIITDNKNDDFNFAGKFGNLNLDYNVFCTLYPGLYFKVKKVTILQNDYNNYTFTYVLQTFGKFLNGDFVPDKTLQNNIVFVPASTIYKG
ncbi:hypothetical protein A9K75_08940 [Campylobacter fetus subsp. testudinum]|uniref:hypothetical protein n=1 Tax=Campylobacter fetus TaxID=196 RepID=UPI000818B3D4|nr:hypothetical protein [Campylobacter fetus]OCR98996.1 hypothetical protein A9K75_08940 [Campylobacter fetus subsp. testudinum]